VISTGRRNPLAVVEGAIRGLAARNVVAVALDGFSGSGKSTLGHPLAEQLGGAVLEATTSTG
jgi:adenylylsulfate kinase-like enzyme